MRIDTIGSLFLTSVIFSSIALAESEISFTYVWPLIQHVYILSTGLDPALVGLSITYAITLVNTTQAFIRTNSELENLVSQPLNVLKDT